MKIVFKKISEMTDAEEVMLNSFYIYYCELPLSISMPNYSGNETACIIFDGKPFNSKIIGALLFEEKTQTDYEKKIFSEAKTFLITRIDVRKELRNKNFGIKLFEEALEYLEKKNKPCLIKIDKTTFSDAPKKYGFEDFGSRNYFYKIIRQ